MADTAPTTTELATQNTTSKGKLAKTTESLKYLYDPKHGPQPSHLRTRTFLRSLRYMTIFLFWRLVRYAKYAAVGAIVAAVSGTVVGSVVSGAAFVIAPGGILGGASMGIVWAVAKFGWRRARHRMDRGGHAVEAADPREDERADAGRREEEERVPRLPSADPW